MYKNIFETGSIGNMELKNRIIFAPTETHFASSEGQVTQRLIDYYVRRAKGGAGLVVLQSTQVCTKLDPIDPNCPSLRLDDRTFIPMMFELTEAVHIAGSKISILLTAGAGAQATGFPYDRGMEGTVSIQNVSAGDIQSSVSNRPVRRLTIDEIEKIIKLFGLAAGRAKQAGFDAVTIHGWGGYLISQFISPYMNNRDDKYGGDFERRLTFLLELIESCKNNAGADFPLILRISIDECIPNGRGVEESIRICRSLEEAGVSAIDICMGTAQAADMIYPSVYDAKGAYVDMAARVKKEVKIPVITQGRLCDPSLIEDVLASEKADFVEMGRGLIADPDWAIKAQASREKEIRKCIYCNSCVQSVRDSQTIRCALNPTAGRESNYREVPPRTETSKKVMIVGAGPAGMEIARIAASKGHNVKLFEETGQLGGGQLSLIGATPKKAEVQQNIINYYQSQFEKLNNLEIELNRTVGIQDVKDENPDTLIIATGALPLSTLTVSGSGSEKCVTAQEVIAGKAKVKGKIVIAGGGLVGIDAAHFLAEQGNEVTIVELLTDIAMEENVINRLKIFKLIDRLKIKIMCGFRIEGLSKEGVQASKDGKTITIAADYVVTALGTASKNPFPDDFLKTLNEYYIVGDAKAPRKIADAISEGFFTGYSL